MKTAVVFYSLDGNCDLVAKEIKSLLNADLIQLHTKNEKNRRGIIKFFWAIGMVLKKKPPLKPYTFDPSAYDLIIIGAPVWASSPASPLRTFLSETPITGKKTAIFVCHAGGMGYGLEKFRAMLTGNTIIAEADFLNAVKTNKDELKQQIENWVKDFK